MTKNQMREVMEGLQEEEMKMREAGQKEYAHNDGNAFANFERVAEQTGMTREQVLFVYLLKHIDGIAAYIKGHRSQREDVVGRVVDARVYLALFAGMVTEDEMKVDPNAPIQSPVKQKRKRQKITDKQVEEIRYLAGTLTYEEIAKRYAVGKVQVGKIIRREQR